MIKLFLLLIGVTQAANLNLYMVFPTLAQAHTRSQQACSQYGCDGTLTREWWAVVPLTDGTAALEIQNVGIYGKTAVVGPCAVGCGLTPAEQASLKTAFQLATKLPNPITYDPAP